MMQIASSVRTLVVVTSIVAAVPIGVTIYKRWNAESPWEREQRAEVHQEAPTHRKARPIESEGLYGQEVASMGPAFHDITLGADATGFDTYATAERIRLAVDDYQSLFIEITKGDDDRIAEVRAVFGYEPRCRELRDALVRAWGKPAVDTVWLGTSHRRASYEEEEMNPGRIVCRLRFDRYVDVDEWVAALPLSLSSPFPRSLAEQTGEHAYTTSGWGPSLGATNQRTHYQATIFHGKVVEISVTATNVSEVDNDVLRTKLVERLRTRPKVTKSDYGLLLMWKRPVPVLLQHAGGFISITIGTLPRSLQDSAAQTDFALEDLVRLPQVNNGGSVRSPR